MPTEVSFDPDDVNNDKPSRILSTNDGHLPSTSDVPKNITIDKTETLLSDEHSIQKIRLDYSAPLLENF